MKSPHASQPSRSLLLSKKDLEDLHTILRAEIRAYVDRRVMEEQAAISPAVCTAFTAFVRDHPQIPIPTFADVLYRLTLSSVYNCFQFIRKSTRDPSTTALASQLTTEIALQLLTPSSND